MSEREILLQFKYWEYTEGPHAGKTLWLMQTTQHPDYPPKEKAIRMYVHKASLFWQDGNDTIGHEVSTFDMGGYVPRRLLNMSIGA